MSLLGNLLGAAQAGGDPAAHRGLIEHVLAMASDSQAGGLGGLIAKLNGAGLSTAVASWVSNNPNQPVSADQVQAALGSNQISQLAQKFGIPSSQVAAHLSQILPEIINHLTPDGNVPHQTAVQSAIALLKGKLFG